MKRNLSIQQCAILLLGCGLLLQACSKVSSPLSPSASDSSPTPAVSAGVSEINWISTNIYRKNQLGVLENGVDVYFSVNGLAETSDTVILSGGDSPVTIPYSETVTLGAGACARYFMDNGSFQYQPGTQYTLSTQTSAGKAWASVTAPGGIQYSPNGGTVSWSSEGTNDRVFVENYGYMETYDSLNTTPDANSTFTIPLSAFPSSGTYYISTTCKTVVNSVNNAMPGSSLQAKDEFWDSVTR